VPALTILGGWRQTHSKIIHLPCPVNSVEVIPRVIAISVQGLGP
jgi:hypothetical protein